MQSHSRVYRETASKERLGAIRELRHGQHNFNVVRISRTPKAERVLCLLSSAYGTKLKLKCDL